MNSAPTKWTVDGVSLFLAMYLLTISVFYSPINVLLRYVIPWGVAASFLEINLILAVLLLFAIHSTGKYPYRIRLDAIDRAMFVWLAYSLIALIMTDAKSTSLPQSIGAIRNMFSPPVWYFLFRFSISSSTGFWRLADFAYVLLKLAIAYILVEFLVVIVFDFREAIELFVKEVRPDIAGVYYDVFSIWVRPAGPIFGQQNASILCDISLVAFYLRYREQRGGGYGWWILAAAIALAMTITITALLVLLLIVLGANLKRFTSSTRRAGTALLVLVALVLVYINRAEILSIRVYGLGGDDILEFYEGIATDAMRIFASSFVGHPFGVGWDVPPEFNVTRDYLFVPPEIFILRMSYYLGSVFFVIFASFHLYLFARYMAMRDTMTRDPVILFAYGVIFVLLLSTIHYESFTNTGFPQLYAFATALLACYSAEARASRAAIESPGRDAGKAGGYPLSEDVKPT